MITRTPIQIRTAILRAAGHIEAHPKEFDYQSNSRPNCNTPGCMLGWIGHFLEISEEEEEMYQHSYMKTVANLLGGSEMVALLEIFNSIGHSSGWYPTTGNPDVNKDAANILRVYANRYFPAEPNVLSELKSAIYGPRIADDICSQEVSSYER